MAKPRGRAFQPGNKAGRGRPRGSRNKSTAAAQELFGENAADVIRKCLRMAKQGDPMAMRLCMERILPARKSPPVRFKLPRIRSVADLAGAMDSIMQAIAKGRLTPGEGQQILADMEYSRSVLETEELSASLQAIKQQLALQERLRPQVGPTYHGLSRFSDQELDDMIVAGKKREEELEAALRDAALPRIEAPNTDKDPATNTALPSKPAPPR
jgi:hypothetical protein